MAFSEVTSRSFRIKTLYLFCAITQTAKNTKTGWDHALRSKRPILPMLTENTAKGKVAATHANSLMM